MLVGRAEERKQSQLRVEGKRGRLPKCGPVEAFLDSLDCVPVVGGCCRHVNEKAIASISAAHATVLSLSEA